MFNVQTPTVPMTVKSPVSFIPINPTIAWALLPTSVTGDIVFNVEILSHHFKITPLTDSARKLCFAFSRKFVIVDRNSDEPKNTVYAASNNKKTWFRFHINCLDDWKNFIYEKGLKEAASYTHKPFFEPTVVELALKDGWTHKPPQEPVRDYLSLPLGEKDKENGLYPEGTGSRSRLVGISTGLGKTFTSLAEIAKRGELFAAVVLARFVVKWVKDIANTLKVKPSEILAVQGSNNLKALTQMAMSPESLKPYKAIVISNRTYENYLRAYERFEDDLPAHGYMCSPDELFERLGVGTRLIDEVHMEFHAQFRLDLYTHVPRSISLSATLVNKDPQIENVYKIAYPLAERYREGPIDKYTDTFAVRYSVNPQWKYKTSYKGSSYSQNAYEESILRNKLFTNAYCKMTKTFMDVGYIRYYEKGHKAIVFCGTVAMCTKVADYLQKSYSHLNVKRYVAEDPYEENYQQPDIRVTTIGSGGTGHDVPGLTDGHLTPGVDSIQANIQAFGRLRKIPNKQTRYYFYTNTDIQKHLNYDRSKMQLMRDRAKSCTPISYGQLF